MRTLIKLCRAVMPPLRVGGTAQHTSRMWHSTAPSMMSQLNSRHFEEITIAMPWGHIAGKWYGSRHVRPLLGLHGWQDNAGTFDTLAPLLPPNIPFLSLDLPGHGRSSWIPPGQFYHSLDYIALLLRLMEEFSWSHVSIIAHSMSSINTFTFAALFPDKIDLFIGLDILKPLIRGNEQILQLMAERLQKQSKYERRMREHSEPPCYEWDQMVERLHQSTQKSVSVEHCKYLLQRNSKPSEHEPHKFYFARDNRLKSAMFAVWSPEMILAMAQRIQCPHLFIKALSAPYYERKEYFDETIAVLQRKANFEFHEVEGTHHVHLNEPDKIAQIINPFISKHRV